MEQRVPATSEVPGSIPTSGKNSGNHVVERATPSVCVGFLRGLRFPPTMQTSPNIAYRANNKQKVAYVLWLQYL